MATVNVHQGGATAMKTMLYGVPDENIINYINNGINSAAEILGNATNSFLNKAQQIFDTYHSSAAIENAKRLVYSLGMSADDENVIYEIPYMGFNNTNQIMRDYIMVHPEVYKLNNQNMINGFQDMYMDLDPATTLIEKEKYRQVMDGVLQDDGEEGGYIMHYSTDNELSMYDKFAILNTWDNVDRMIAEGYDPTDPEQEEL